MALVFPRQQELSTALQLQLGTLCRRRKASRGTPDYADLHVDRLAATSGYCF
jgi:hypothetical protein